MPPQHNDPSERRATQRVPSPGLSAAPAVVSIESHPWRVEDVSTTGLRLTLDGNTPPNNTLLLNVYDGETLLLGPVTARVIHANSHRAGLALENLDASQQTALESTLQNLAYSGAVDCESLFKRFRGKKAFLARMIRLFSGDATEKLAAMEQAVSSGDPTVAMSLAHSLAGAAAIMAAPQLRNLCMEFENLMRAPHNAESAQDMLTAINREIIAVLLALHALGVSEDPGAAGDAAKNVHRPVSQA